MTPNPAPTSQSLYEINTCIWLAELSQSLGRPATLRDIPDAAIDALAARGFDWLWLLGVWDIGAAGRAVSASQPDWRAGYRARLPDFQDRDVSGSPFAIRSYTVREAYGGNVALSELRGRLHARGLRLMLDFVPNHTAIDHPAVSSRPEFFVHGSEADLAVALKNYFRAATAAGPAILAHGRDPYFPGWPDTVQLDYRRPDVREFMLGELLKVSELCDGVRCDMVMLLLPEVFARTWGPGPPPGDATHALFWPTAISAVRARSASFVFMAEVYWGLEQQLQVLGFDFTYDKHLFDLLRARDAGGIRAHLRAGSTYQQHSVHFLENHDEPRAAYTFSPEVQQAAAVIAFLAPGLRLFHEGQFEGRRVETSVHLNRRAVEPVDAEIESFYERLLACVRRPVARQGRWQLLDCRQAWSGNPTHDRFIAFLWEKEPDHTLLIAVNYGPIQGQCYVDLSGCQFDGRPVTLQDLLGDTEYQRDGADLQARGLYLDEPAWKAYVFAVRKTK